MKSLKENRMTMKYFTLFFLSFLFCSCQSEGQEYQKNIIDFKKLDFNTFNAEDFYRNANEENNLKISSNLQYVEISDFDNGWVEFQVTKSSDSDVVAEFDSIKFSTINAIASQEGKLKIVNSETYLKPEEVHKLYLNLTDFYGKETSIDTSDYDKYTHIHTCTWEVDDRIIKLVSIFNPQSAESLEEINSKIPDKDSKIINKRPKTILFICNKESLTEVLHLSNPYNNWPKFK